MCNCTLRYNWDVIATSTCHWVNWPQLSLFGSKNHLMASCLSFCYHCITSLVLLPATSFLNMNSWIDFLWLESVACYQGWCRIKGRLLGRQNSYDFSKILICQKQRIKLSMGLLWAWISASLHRSKQGLKLWSSSSFHCDFSNDLHTFLSLCLHCSSNLGFKGLLSPLFLGPFSWFS